MSEAGNWSGVERGAAARVLLHELVTLLERLIKEDEPSHIDLRSMELGLDDRALLQQTLGEGEITAEVENFGHVLVRESGYAGIWWVTHTDDSGQVISEFIEVSYCPEVLIAEVETVADGYNALRAHLFEMGMSHRNG
ncbi:MAG: hydrogenase expression/formation protein [Chromatiales bacterium]|nr:hydrogenase expression/formation protein [Chromatiales bacterium]